MEKSRYQVSLPEKKEELLFLGRLRDGSFRTPETNPATKLAWSQVQIAAKYNVSKATVTKRKKSSVKILGIDTSSRKITKICRLEPAAFPDIERAREVCMCERIMYMRGESVFREEAFKRAALAIRDAMVKGKEDGVGNDMTTEERELIKATTNRWCSFKASSQ